MMKKPLILTFALLGLCITDTEHVSAATEEECIPQDAATARKTHRRRPGRESIDCVPVENPGSQRTTGSDQAIPVVGPDGSTVDQLWMRKRNPVSPVPRPRIEDYAESVPMPDRWRIVDTLGYQERWYDPYNRNILKADKPLHGEWFFNLGIISDTTFEKRDIPITVGNASSDNPGNIDVFGDPDQDFFNQNLSLEFVYYKGDTVFRPPDYEFRFIPVFNYNYLELEEIQGVNFSSTAGKRRDDYHIGIQAAFADVHLRNVSDRFDFDSLRVGIQPFSTDFRGFLFQDNQLGIRLFGNRDNNIFQYNLALFQRLEKDLNSGLNDTSESVRDDYIFAANLYWQDLFVKGFVSQVTLVHNKNDEDGEVFFDQNGFIARPSSFGREIARNYDVTYIGYNGDGHFGRFNLTTSIYYAFGKNDQGVFVNEDVDISAVFFAAEMSMDFDWIRPRFSVLYGSGDDDPFDDVDTGFDAIFENPQFAGSDSSYWVRQAVPFIGGGRVILSSRNGVLNSLRSSKEQGQSNFTNPGIILVGAGVDMDILPELRFSANYNLLSFDKTQVLEVARNQGDIDEFIGQDISISLIYRPLMSQNIVARASYAMLLPGDGYDDLFPDDDSQYFLFNLVLAY